MEDQKLNYNCDHGTNTMIEWYYLPVLRSTITVKYVVEVDRYNKVCIEEKKADYSADITREKRSNTVGNKQSSTSLETEFLLNQTS